MKDSLAHVRRAPALPPTRGRVAGSVGLALMLAGCADRAPPARFPAAQPPELAKPLEEDGAAAPDQPSVSEAEDGDEGPAATEGAPAATEGSGEREGGDPAPEAPASDEPAEAPEG